ncbi:hypothetical protein [Bacillus sp. THAF10]|uniref:hypothetical protein n=1 Tax=Bacillus sp. THAF10 TaxID=2587848 RepID=UPI001C12B155|nr:hypothetical protein [Bacillus sp. THAF10]
MVGCSNQSKEKVLIEQNLVHLHNGTPEAAMNFFNEKIQLGDGGLHSYHDDNKTYLMLLEPNRMISQIQELTDEIRVYTVFNDGPGSFNMQNEINNVLYIKVIDQTEKPITLIKEKQ